MLGCTSNGIPQFKWPAIPWFSRQEEAPPPPDVLSLWTWDEGDERLRNLQRMLAQFEDEHPDQEIALTVVNDYAPSLRAAFEQGDPPDVFLVDGFRFPRLAAEGFLASGDNRLDSPEDFYPVLRDAFMYDQETYCLPREVRVLALIYNRAHFESAGVQPPTTWDEFRAAAQALTDPNGNAFGFIAAPDLSRWLPFLLQAGGRLVNEAGDGAAINSPQGLQAVQFYIQLFRDNFAGQPAESVSSWGGEALGKGKGAMVIEGNWIIPYLKQEFPDTAFGVASLPAGPAGRGTVAFTSCYAVAAGTPRAEAAFELANFLTRADNMRAWPADGSSMPSRLSLADAWRAEFPELSPFLEGLDVAVVWQLPPGMETIVPVFNRGMLQLFDAEIEPEDLLAAVERAAKVSDSQ